MRPAKRVLILAKDEGEISHLVLPLRVRGLKVEVAFSEEQLDAALLSYHQDIIVWWMPGAASPAIVEMARVANVPILLVLGSNALAHLGEEIGCSRWIVSPAMMDFAEELRMALARKPGPKKKLEVEPLEEERFPLKHLDVGARTFIPDREGTRRAHDQANYWRSKTGHRFSVQGFVKEGVRGAYVKRVA